MLFSYVAAHVYFIRTYNASVKHQKFNKVFYYLGQHVSTLIESS